MILVDVLIEPDAITAATDTLVTYRPHDIHVGFAERRLDHRVPREDLPWPVARPGAPGVRWHRASWRKPRACDTKGPGF